MKKVAIYPGTFDPITYGHVDVINKSLKLFDSIIVAISNSSHKDQLFDIEERTKILKDSLFKDLNFKKKKIEVMIYVKNIIQILF